MAITNAKFPMTALSSGIGTLGSWQVHQVFKAEPIVSLGEVDSVFKNPVDSAGMQLAEFSSFGFYTILTGATVDVELKILQSFDNVAVNFILPDSDFSFNIITGASKHINVVTPHPMPFIRFRVSGGATNGADTLITAYVFLKSS